MLRLPSRRPVGSSADSHRAGLRSRGDGRHAERTPSGSAAARGGENTRFPGTRGDGAPLCALCHTSLPQRRRNKSSPQTGLSQVRGPWTLFTA